MQQMLEQGHNLPCGLDPETFINDCYFAYYDLTTSLGNTPACTKSPVKGGKLRGYITLDKVAPCPLVVICITISDCVLSLYGSGKCQLETT